MTNGELTRDESLSPEQRGRVDEVCDRFEAAWRAGERPSIRAFLGDAVEGERVALLRHLVLLEVDYRRMRGERPDAREYAEAYPELPAGWLARELGTPVASPVERYRLAGEIGHGGMGSVLRGHDPHMGRDLALKVLLERHRGHAQLEQRFLEEARIAGRLQHPGIVPVYDLGEFADRRPFFTMKLVEGRTLADLLKERKEPAQEQARFLGIFEQICQTMAYAHAQGVIHRDLKPANVMVGAFGEVQVMDWGLAKVLGRGREEGAPGADTPDGAGTRGERGRDTDQGERTRHGQAMGTLAYMAPEQARGEVNRVDQRADVFGLGAILCEILTGKPPFAGNDGKKVLARAQAGEHAEALGALGGCGAEAELIALARGCLAVEPGERPGDAGAVARALAAYLASVTERKRAAELEAARAKARAQAER